MSESEFYEVSFKRFKAENEDGSGRINIIDSGKLRTTGLEATQKSMKIRELYRQVKKLEQELR